MHNAAKLLPQSKGIVKKRNRSPLIFSVMHTSTEHSQSNSITMLTQPKHCAVVPIDEKAVLVCRTHGNDEILRYASCTNGIVVSRTPEPKPLNGQCTQISSLVGGLPDKSKLDWNSANDSDSYVT